MISFLHLKYEFLHSCDIWVRYYCPNCLNKLGMKQCNYLNSILGNYLKVLKLHVLILIIFWKNMGKLFKGDIIQGRILIKEIRYILKIQKNTIKSNFETENTNFYSLYKFSTILMCLCIIFQNLPLIFLNLMKKF